MSRWPKKALGEICEINIGRTPSRSEPKYWGEGLPWLSIADMNQGRLLSTTKEQITRDAAQKIMGPPAPTGTVALSFKLSIGKVGIIQSPMHTNEAIATLPIRSTESLDADYLYWALKSINLTRETDDAVMGKTLNKRKLERLEIPLPPRHEQKSIVDTLDSLESFQKKRRRSIELLDELAQSIFLEMLGDPKVNPKNWEAKEFSSLFDKKPNYGTMTPASQNGEWLCLRVANIQNWEISLHDRKYVDLDSKAIERHTVEDGDLLLARAIATQDHLGKAIVARPNGEKWAFDSHLMRIRLNKSFAYPEFIRHLLKSPGGRQIFLKATRRSAVQFNINTKEISNLEIPVPPLSLQGEFVDKLSKLEELKIKYQAHLAHLDELFSSVQQRAFDGTLWDDPVMTS